MKKAVPTLRDGPSKRWLQYSCLNGHHAETVDDDQKADHQVKTLSPPQIECAVDFAHHLFVIHKRHNATDNEKEQATRGQKPDVLQRRHLIRPTG